MKKKNTRSKCRPTTVIDAMLWEQFVQTAAKRLGYKKGVIQTALQLALKTWISSAENGKSNNRPRKAKKSPAMTGVVASQRKREVKTDE